MRGRLQLLIRVSIACYMPLMERRDFLKAGALAGSAAGLGTIGCSAVLDGMRASASAVPGADELLALDMDSFLKRLDSSLGFIQSTSSLDSVLPNGARTIAKTDPRFEHSEEVVRKTLRTLLLSSSFSDLPEAGRAHPGMQMRMMSSLKEMDDAMIGMNTMLTSLTSTERSDIGRLMRKDPTVTNRILNGLDDEALKAGVNEKRRTHLNDVGKHACFRLRQSTSLFIDEHDEKLKKVAARDGSASAFERRLMAQMGEEAFWDTHARQLALANAWRNVPGMAQAVPPPAGTDGPPAGPVGTAPMATGTVQVYPYLPPSNPPPGFVPAYGPPVPYGPPVVNPTVDSEGRDLQKLRKGNILLGVGGGLFGLGLIAGAIAIGLATSNEGLGAAFVTTAAALLGLGGIGCLIAGAVIRGRA